MHVTLFDLFLNEKSVLKGLIFVISMQFVQILMVLILAHVIRVLKIFSQLQSLLEVGYKLNCTMVEFNFRRLFMS